MRAHPLSLNNRPPAGWRPAKGKESRDDLSLPPVSAAAFSDELKPDLLVGLYAYFQDGRARIYVLKRGSDVVLVL